MGKQDNDQLELFSSSKDTIHLKHQNDNPFLGYIKIYEKTILAIIGIVTVGIISFSLGVERGKKISMTRFDSRFDVVSRQQKPSVTSSLEKSAISENRTKEAIKTEQKIQPKFLEKQGYIIQLASYKNKSFADKEAELLKKKGVSALVMPKGSFSVLYVGNLTNKEIALSLLPELKKRYRDCYIRRL